jgi:hypothetical protein
MPSHPTRHGAYFLRRSERGREEVFQFPNHRELVIAFARQYKSARGDQYIPILAFSSDRLRLSVLHQRRVQTAHSKFGAVWMIQTNSRVAFEAFGPTGKPLKIEGLLESTLGCDTEQPRSRRGGIYCEYGPVPHVHRQRLGRRYFREIATMNELRMNQPLHFDEFEPIARATRRATNLPSAWDDIATARRSRGWKEQSKGSKAWDR